MKISDNHQNPLVSICIPVYNQGAMVWRAIESSINQSYTNIEIIVVDNASTDNTREVVLNYVAKDSRVKYFINEKNIGSGRNFLVSFEKAQGEFLQALGSDDWLSKNYIETGVRAFSKNPDAAVVVTDILSFILEKKTGQLSFLDDLPLRSGRYSVDWFFRGVYLGYVPTGFISFLRRTDIILALRAVLSDPINFLQRGERREPMDMPAFLEILSKYKYAVITKEAAYIKTVHGLEQVGLQGEFRTADGRIKYAIAIRKAYESFFVRHKITNHLFFLKLFGGASIAVNALFFIFKRGLRKEDRRSYFLAVKEFFEGYSKKERWFIILITPFYVLWRAVKRAYDLIYKNKNFIPKPALFITEELKFKS